MKIDFGWANPTAVVLFQKDYSRIEKVNGLRRETSRSWFQKDYSRIENDFPRIQQSSLLVSEGL